MQTNKSKTKLKSKYAQDSKKLNVDSVQREQKSSAAQNRSRSIGFYFDRSIFLQKQNSAENRQN